MKYVSVTTPGSDISKPIFNYFDDYLVSLGEPATSRAWTLMQLVRHIKRMIKEKPSTSNLYIDSGGFQIIVGYVLKERIIEFIDSYHFILETFKDDIDQIFALDVFSPSFFPEIKQPKTFEDPLNPRFDIPFDYNLQDAGTKEMYELNKYSMNSSIDLIKNYPEIADKQLFILQSGNNLTYNMWKDLFLDLEVYKYYKRWSVGGLVGLKKRTNAKFSHAVASTLWLLTYQTKYKFAIDQMHWLGQSSRLSFLSMALFERLYNINMTSDSSQLVRFAPIEHKFPLIYKDEEKDDYILINDEAAVLHHMISNHSIPDLCHTCDEFHPDKRVEGQDEISTLEYYHKTKRFHNADFIELQAQNIFHEMGFANRMADKIMEIGIDKFDNEQQLRNLHPILDRGRTAMELLNNINLFKRYKNIVISGDTDGADSIMQEIVENYPH